jgi:hypothetical protein
MPLMRGNISIIEASPCLVRRLFGARPGGMHNSHEEGPSHGVILQNLGQSSPAVPTHKSLQKLCLHAVGQRSLYCRAAVPVAHSHLPSFLPARFVLPWFLKSWLPLLLVTPFSLPVDKEEEKRDYTCI